MQIALIKSYTEKLWRSPETYQLIEDSLSEKWPVQSINTKEPEALYSFLINLQQEHDERIFVFNIAEYLDERNKASFLPSLLEEWEIPHLGSNAEVISIGLDKGRTKDALDKNGIPNPRSFVANREDTDMQERAEKIGYPLIVKPISEGGHIGINEDSIAYDYPALNKLVQQIFDIYHQSALVEVYITGEGMREFSVGIMDGETRLFTPIEIDYDAMGVKEKILSFETAQGDLERIKLVQDAGIRGQIIDLTGKTFDAVGARDYSRVDLRMDQTGCYVFEINIMPGLGPHSFLPQAAKDIHGLEYGQLIQKLAEDSMQRQNIGLVSD